MATDIRIGCLNDVLTQKAAKALKSPVYRYVVTSWPSVPIRAYGVTWPAKYAFHTWDVFAFFDALDTAFPKGPAKSDEEFRRNIQEELLSLVHAGKPRDKLWLPYPNNTALIADKITFVDRYNKPQCEMWEKYNILPYSWIN